MRTTMRFGATGFLLAGFAIAAALYQTVALPADVNWSVREGEDPLSGQDRCLLESVRKTVDDGQTSTTVQIVYTGDAIVVSTDSNVDLSYPGVGMQVDGEQVANIDGLVGLTAVKFSSDMATVLERFKRGSVVQIALGFWPTWPQTETVVTPFSLIGFTRAHQQFLACDGTG